MEGSVVNNICRICMSISEDVISIFNHFIATTVASMITEITGIEVCQSDGLPENCCQKCADEMLAAHHLRLKCLETDDELKKLLLVSFLNDGNDSAFDADSIDGFKQNGAAFDRNTLDCSNITVDDLHLNKFDESHGIASDRIGESEFQVPDAHKCCGCLQSFSSQQKLFEHSASVHKNEISSDDSKLFECDICYKKYGSKPTLQRHKRNATKYVAATSGTRCCRCKIDFKTLDKLRGHSEQVHLTDKLIDLDGSKPFQCDICFKRFVTQKTLTKHKQWINSENIFQCTHCGKTFMRRVSLDNHEKIHLHLRRNKGKSNDVQMTYECQECQKTFTRKSNLQNHQQLHSGIRPYQCDMCKKKFANKDNLKYHMKLHMEPVTSYNCPMCDKICRSPELLKSHLISHTVEKMHQCNICLVKFRAASYLKTHERTHTGEKPFKCENCDKTFGHYSGYKRHLLIHATDKPFMCNYCGRTFSNRPNLLVHEKFHTGEKNSPCDICGKLFVHSKYMKKHRKIHKKQ